MKRSAFFLLLAACFAYTVPKFPVSAGAEPISTNAGLSVVTLNMAKEPDPGRVLRELRSERALETADILLLQEVKQNENQRQCVAEQMAAELGMQVAYSPAETGVTDQGLAILSRFPLRDIDVRTLKRYDLRYRSRSRILLAATADTPAGPIRVLNTHLDTRLNTRERLEQLNPVLQDSPKFAGPRIVGGDFNSNGFAWFAHVLPVPFFRSQAYGVQEFMSRHGYRTALPVGERTHDHLGMHLDWIWVHGLESKTYRVYPLDFSDHHAVLAHVELP